jgi:hypothetical protein
MKSSISALVAVALLLAGECLGHTAILPPFPDKALIFNTTVAPPGCKYLSSDAGFPADSLWRSTFPGIYKKLKGTMGPDWMVQTRTVADVQKAVNFARDHNVRLSVITT